MAILTDKTFKGMVLKSYLNINRFTVQKQIQLIQGQTPVIQWTVTAELFFNTENKEYLLENIPFAFLTTDPERINMKDIYREVKKVYNGADV